MKNLLLGLVVTTSAMASTIDSYSLPILGIDTRESFSLYTQATRTEYRYETETRVCYRQIIDGYRRVCNGYNNIVNPREPRDPRHPIPPREPRYPDPRPEPRPYPRPPICHDEPIYRTIPYTCYENVRIPYEVIDHQTISNFNVSISNPEALKLPEQCLINFTVLGDNLSTGTQCNEYLVLSTNSQNVTIDRTGTKIQSFDFNIQLFDKILAIGALNGGLANMHMDGQNLVVVTGDLNLSKNFTLKLFVERKRFLKEDEVLINRNLAPNEYVFTSTGGTTGLTSINLNSLLGGINKSKKHKIKLQLDVVIPKGQVMNNNLPALHQVSEITVWDN